MNLPFLSSRSIPIFINLGNSLTLMSSLSSLRFGVSCVGKALVQYVPGFLNDSSMRLTLDYKHTKNMHIFVYFSIYFIGAKSSRISYYLSFSFFLFS